MESLDRVRRGKQPFTLVLAGGGARGFAHAGVLRGLDSLGYQPSAIVGVSMGAVVGATYALRSDWYRALLELDLRALPTPLREPEGARRSIANTVRWPATLMRAVWEMFFGWGAGTSARAPARAAMGRLTAERTLEEGRIEIAVCATDLVSGSRVILRTGPASDALHASAALAGIAPPLKRGGQLLADGVHADIAPIDVARAFGHPVVITIDPGQALVTGEIRNGFGAMMRALEICQLQHARLRVAKADLVLRPLFRRTIDTLDFGARRGCIAAGRRVVRTQRPEIERLLCGANAEVA